MVKISGMTGIIGALIFVATACLPARGGHPQATDYDNTCVDVSECELVRQAPGCCGCSTWHGLNAPAAAEFNADQERYWNRHTCRYQCAIGCFVPDEASVELACEAGQCQAILQGDTGL